MKLMKERVSVLLLLMVIPVCILQMAFRPGNTVGKIELGRRLFFDPILSSDSSVSCASCHREQFAFADTSAVSIGVHGRKGKRNTPTIMNILLGRKFFFWDGRAASLEEQALKPIEDPSEMNLPLGEAISRLRKNEQYRNDFQNVFHQLPDTANLAAAIAAFERTLETSNSIFDEWKFSDNPAAVSDEVKKGFELFNGKAKCVRCHFGADFTTQEFRNIGLFDGMKLNDSGRSAITKNREDLGKFMTPTLRNIELTAPYMHNGMFGTLDEVIEFYNDTRKLVSNPINRDTILSQPLGLSAREKAELKGFLLSLTDKRFK